jgi:hypothetical protein
MHYRRFILLIGFLVANTALRAQYTALKSPDQFLPHALGEQFTPHHLLTDYYEYLAANAPRTMRLERYGQTIEARPLHIAIFGTPENINRLEQIRLNNLRMAGMADGVPDMANPVVIVWISMSVHGNESSGAEAGMALAHRLAAQSDADVQKWLANTLVIVDVALNPDGFDRYAQWNRMVSNRLKTPGHEAREHHEPWPGGRVNHYHFDLNRDWAWATQLETRQRLTVYQKWMPQVHPDVHEQGIDEPYYFAPAAEPLHDYITPWQREFQVKIGKNNARKFDEKGWLYFTKEVFDLFYPSYGDTYPMFNGSIGMTYEQAGGPPAGRAILIDSGDTLTLHDRIAHHLTTCLATIEISSQNAAALTENFRKYFRQAVTQPQGVYKTYIIRESNDPNKIETLCQLLDRHKIQYGRAGVAASNLRGFDYTEGKEKTVSIGANDVLISAYQPKSVLVQVLFDPESRMSDSLTYDITAWTLPFAHGIDACAVKERIDPKTGYEHYTAPETLPAAVPYTWCIPRHTLSDATFLGELLQKGVKVRYATHPYEIAGQKLEAGTLIVSRGDNRPIADALDGIVKTAAQHNNVALIPVFTGFVDKGKDFGSESLPLVPAANVAIVYGDAVDALAYGQTWYFFEQDLKYPITPIATGSLSRTTLYDFTTLIIPDGNYSFSDSQIKNIQEWVRDGGRLITMEGGTRMLTDREGFGMKRKEEEKKDAFAAPKHYTSRERDRLSDNLPGAIVRAKTDPTHPLSYGIGRQYYSMKTSPDALELTNNTTSVIYLEEDYQSYGFIGYRVKPRLKNTPIAAVQSLGSGQVVYFTDNPLFRGFWQQGKVLFANALFMGD